MREASGIEVGGSRARLRYARAGAGLLALLVIAGAWMMVPRRWPGLRRWIVVGCWRAINAGLGLRIRVHGVPMAGGLYVANHVSWSDIPVLGRLLDAPFVAKGEVAGWPLIGRLTAAYDCIFVDREARGAVGGQAREVGAHLAAGASLILFPEGTTGEGADVLPFRSSLFALVGGNGDGGARFVQPVAIRYRGPDGAVLDAAGRRAVAWIDDDVLGTHVAALARRGGAVVDVYFEPPIATEGQDRKALARATQAAISGRLQALNPQAA